MFYKFWKMGEDFFEEVLLENGEQNI